MPYFQRCIKELEAIYKFIIYQTHIKLRFYAFILLSITTSLKQNWDKYMYIHNNRKYEKIIIFLNFQTSVLFICINWSNNDV